MALTKCPRCELNYILDGGSLCTVCRREVRGEQTDDEVVEMCSECGENPAVPGSEYCAQCLKEISRRSSSSSSEDETISVDEATLGIDTVSTMDEIVIENVNAEGAPFGEDEDFMDDEDDDEDEPDEAIGGKQRKKRGRSQDAELKKSGFSVVDGSDIG